MNEPPRIYNISYGFSFHSPSSDDRGWLAINIITRRCEPVAILLALKINGLVFLSW